MSEFPWLVGGIYYPENGYYINSSGSQNHSLDLVSEYVEPAAGPQILEWKRGVPTTEECYGWWIVHGGKNDTPFVLQDCPIYRPGQSERDWFCESDWYIAVRIRPVSPPRPAPTILYEYINNVGDKLWILAHVNLPGWTATGNMREVQLNN